MKKDKVDHQFESVIKYLKERKNLIDRVSSFTEEHTENEEKYVKTLRKHGENSHITKAAYNFLIHNLITHKIRIIKSGEYTIFKDLFIPYNKLVLSIPPYVASVFYFYNIFNIIFNRYYNL